MNEGRFLIEMIIGGLASIAMLFMAYTINAIKKSIDDLLSDVKHLERRVSKLEAGREESLGFRETIRIMFDKVQQQNDMIMGKLNKVEAWMDRKEADILQFYRDFDLQKRDDK